MNFNTYQYERPNFESFKQKYNSLLNLFISSTNKEASIEALNSLNSLRNNWDSKAQIAFIRNSINTKDEFYEKEQAFFDEYGPLNAELDNKYFKALVNSKFEPDLAEHFGVQFINLAKAQLKTFDSSIIPDLQLENKLVSSYSKLISSGTVEFDGKTMPITKLGPYMVSSDRNVRKNARIASVTFFEENEDEFDTIYDKLVKIRTQIALKLGFDSFTELAYLRLGRTDYDKQMVSSYRQSIVKQIIPITSTLYKQQCERLGLDKLKIYDESYRFNTGNPTPKDSADIMLKNGLKMYQELSPETGTFFEKMLNENFLDVLSKDGKAPGGYCTMISDLKMPFIFSNFNGTQGDVDVLTHETGHAFQAYQSRNLQIPEYKFPTYEASEIHSMSMEFLTWPWMNLFFGEDTEKYYYSHLSSALLFMPYGALIDHFQHDVYANPTWSPEKRKERYSELEKIYQPDRDYDGIDYLERGNLWVRQTHVFMEPFYYIDYTLAQICALQFWINNNKDKEQTWQKYLDLCSLGGSKSFLDLLNSIDLLSPFEPECISNVACEVNKFLDSIDSSSF